MLEFLLVTPLLLYCVALYLGRRTRLENESRRFLTRDEATFSLNAFAAQGSVGILVVVENRANNRFIQFQILEKKEGGKSLVWDIPLIDGKSKAEAELVSRLSEFEMKSKEITDQKVRVLQVELGSQPSDLREGIGLAMKISQIGEPLDIWFGSTL